MDGWLTYVKVGLRWFYNLLSVCTRRRLIVNTLLAIKNLLLEEFKVLAENFDCQTIQVYRLTASFIDPMCLFLDFLVFEDHILLDLEHFVAETLNCHQFIIWLRLLNLEEYLKDLMVLVLHINKSQFLLFILANEADKLTALFNLVQTLDKLVGEVLNPFDVFVLDLH